MDVPARSNMAGGAMPAVREHKTLRLLLADSQEIFRRGLRVLLEADGHQVAGEVGDGIEAMRQVRDSKPDVVILEARLPGLNGIDIAHRLLQPPMAIASLVLVERAGEALLHRILREGARGVAPRGLPCGELLAGLQRVARGNTWVAPQLGVECDLDYLQKVGNDDRVDVPWQIDRLTPRQREILQLIAEGQDARSIAERLSLSIKTVETHRAQLMERLGLFDVALLTRFAVRCGLVSD